MGQKLDPEVERMPAQQREQPPYSERVRVEPASNDLVAGRCQGCTPAAAAIACMQVGRAAAAHTVSPACKQHAQEKQLSSL